MFEAGGKLFSIISNLHIFPGGEGSEVRFYTYKDQKFDS